MAHCKKSNMAFGVFPECYDELCICEVSKIQKSSEVGSVSD